MSATPSPLSIAVLVSGTGRGSNLGALIDACAHGEIHGKIVLVIGTRRDAPALERADAAGVPVAVVSPRQYADDEEGYANALLRLLDRSQVDLICLAGYLRKLPAKVVTAYAGRILNIHPSLLPLFGGQGMYGLHVHQAVLESGMKVSGCTVHFVDEHYDTGPIVIQTPVPVLDNDTPETLAARILPEEHRAYVRAVQLFAAGRLRIDGRRVRILPETQAAQSADELEIAAYQEPTVSERRKP
ncbi:MAG: phosphoribosylglycinamide formyltransferase [Chloroherpetonaceae bacterium]|nr:phosphoribosylglycinamide formyltransferase [Chthonomonadaceae bacterium]MDW8208875.1 phosphoribosylglycinamide formyltransferase [Chloroherpetonaceae bacterium]